MPGKQPRYVVQVRCPITGAVRYAVAARVSWTTDRHPANATRLRWGAARDAASVFGKLWQPRILACEE
jgi:hypothetical protein